MGILVTGGCGFIGSHLCAFFTGGGQHVTVLDDLSSGRRGNLVHPARVTLVEGDVADAALVRRLAAEAEAVYHLAAIASVAACSADPSRAARTHLAGTQAVFDAVAAAQKQSGRVIPMVYASSAAVYGNNPTLPLTETSAMQPLSLYGKHKREGERIAARAFAEQGVRNVGLRFFNVYGARQDPGSAYSGVISKFIDGARTDAPLTIFGDGEQTRDFVYVGDVVNCLVNAARYAENAMGNGGDLFNVCTGTATSLKQLAHTIGAVMGKKALAIHYLPARADDIRHSLGDPLAVMTAFHVGQWTSLHRGLEHMVGPDA